MKPSFECKAKNIKANLNLYKYAMLSALLIMIGGVVSLSVILASSEERYEVATIISPIIVIFAAFALLSYNLYKKFSRYVELSNSRGFPDIRLDEDGIHIFMGVLFNNNFVKPNEPNYVYYVSWDNVEGSKTLNTNKGRFLRVLLNTKKPAQIDVPLRYFGKQQGDDLLNAFTECKDAYMKKGDFTETQPH